MCAQLWPDITAAQNNRINSQVQYTTTSTVTCWLLVTNISHMQPVMVKLLSWTDNSTSYISVKANSVCKLMNLLQQNNDWSTKRITSFMQCTTSLPCPPYWKTAPDQTALFFHIPFTIHINVIIVSGSWSYPGRPHLVFAPNMVIPL
jgi:hypothetical protein